MVDTDKGLVEFYAIFVILRKLNVKRKVFDAYINVALQGTNKGHGNPPVKITRLDAKHPSKIQHLR